MTVLYKVLGQTHPVAITNTPLYTTPAATSAVCSTILICNLGGSTTYRIAVRVANAAIEDKQYIVYEAAISQYDTTMLTIGLTLAATDVVTVFSNSSDLTFQLFGSEIT